MDKEKFLDRDNFFHKIEEIKQEIKKNNSKAQLSVLIGNGFGLSHPVLGDAFKWDMHAALCHSWRDLLPEWSKKCPESDLEEIRINVLKKILRYYIKKLFSVMESEENDNLNTLYRGYINKIRTQYNCEDFLSNWDNIFTLNYDPILYFEILEILRNKKVFFDGFVAQGDEGQDGCLGKYYDDEEYNNNDRFLKQEYIACKLKEDKSKKTKILYLHGSWFIRVDENDKKLRKLSFCSSEDESIKIKELFENGTPYLVLEDRWRVKKALLEADCNPYLKHCYDQLKEINGALLVFGCSFKRDNHILQALLDNKNLEEIYITYLTKKDCVGILQALLRENEKLDKIYITYLEEKDREDVEEELKKVVEEGVATYAQVTTLLEKIVFGDKGDSSSSPKGKSKTIEFIHIEENVIWSE